ncbi:hypothetical protein H5410_036417 [Solanum commersonii]|uniref:Uncharacterized protein n=1 Tax=Solanum commersonii TaxID=4109 RepID=A0A9J5Y455_SOLCO|nr:hypothetical protein H5410_036417 [Solanum commersonii]
MEISSLSGNLPRFKCVPLGYHMKTRYGTRAHPLGQNLMSTHSLGHQSSGLGFATSLSGKPKTHE